MDSFVFVQQDNYERIFTARTALTTKITSHDYYNPYDEGNFSDLFPVLYFMFAFCTCTIHTMAQKYETLQMCERCEKKRKPLFEVQACLCRPMFVRRERLWQQAYLMLCSFSLVFLAKSHIFTHISVIQYWACVHFSKGQLRVRYLCCNLI